MINMKTRFAFIFGPITDGTLRFLLLNQFHSLFISQSVCFAKMSKSIIFWIMISGHATHSIIAFFTIRTMTYGTIFIFSLNKLF